MSSTKAIFCEVTFLFDFEKLRRQLFRSLEQKTSSSDKHIELKHIEKMRKFNMPLVCNLFMQGRREPRPQLSPLPLNEKRGRGERTWERNWGKKS